MMHWYEDDNTSVVGFVGKSIALGIIVTMIILAVVVLLAVLA